MNALGAVLAQPGAVALGWTLLHFIWQGTLAACVLAGANAFIPARNANARYVAACVTLALMLGLAAGTFTMYRTGHGNAIAAWTRSGAPAMAHRVATPLPPVSIEPAPVSDPDVPALPKLQSGAEPGLEVPIGPLPTHPDVWFVEHFGFLVPWLAAVWFIGVLALSLRFIGGWVVAQRLRRGVVTATVAALQPTLERLRERLNVSLPVRLVESARIEVPTVIGCLRPVILLPVSVMTGLSAIQLEALLAHELAHIRRHDYFVNLCQTVIETLLFYHPAVWWVSHRIRAEREHCCDDVAVAVCGSALTYARALADLEQSRMVPRLAMAASGGSLLARILRLVKGTPDRAPRASQWMAGAVAMATVLLVIAGARLAPVSHAAEKTDAQVAILGADDDAVADDETTPANDESTCPEGKKCDSTCPPSTCEIKNESVSTDEGVAVTVSMDETACKDQEAKACKDAEKACKDAEKACKEKDKDKSESDQEAIEAAEQAIDQAGPALESAGKALQSQQLGRVYSDWMKSQKTTIVSRRDIERALRAAQQSMRMQRGAMRQDMKEARIAQQVPVPVEKAVKVDEALVKAYAEKLRDRGVSEEYVRGMAELQQQITIEQLTQLSDHGVAVAYLKRLEELGYDDLAPDQVIRLNDQGISPEYVAGMSFLGYDKFSVDDLILLHNQDVSPDFIGELNVLGYRDLPIRQIVTLRQQDVSPDYIGKLKSMGYKLTVPELVLLRQQGVTAEFIAELRGLGYGHLTVQQLVKLRQQGVTPKYISSLDGRGLMELPPDDLVALFSSGVTGEFLLKARKAGIDVSKLKVRELINLSNHGLESLDTKN